MITIPIVKNISVSKPCPFCGNKLLTFVLVEDNETVDTNLNDSKKVIIKGSLVCPNCGAKGANRYIVLNYSDSYSFVDKLRKKSEHCEHLIDICVEAWNSYVVDPKYVRCKDIVDKLISVVNSIHEEEKK